MKYNVSMKVALVHDQLAEFGGAERVLISLKKAYPDADVYVSFIDRNKLGIHASEFRDWKIFESRARYIPFFSRLYSPLRFLLPWIWRSFDLSSYDLVICSSSWGMSKGVSLIKSKGKIQNAKSEHRPLSDSLSTFNSQLSTKFVCYLHTPPRYLYGYDESSLKKYLVVRIYALIVNHFLRRYDYESSQTIDQFIFNSEEIRQRSLKFYRRDGVVVHPPIKIPNSPASRDFANSQVPNNDQNQSKISSHSDKVASGAYFLTVSRLAPTKHIDVIIGAANQMKLPLKIVGVGREEAYLRSIAGPSVEFCGSVPDEQLQILYAGARAFLYASVDEDFGMVPVEAMRQGVPVIAYGSGGVKETVSHLERGIQYTEMSVRSILQAISIFDSLSPTKISEIQSNGIAFAKSCDEAHFISSLQLRLSSV